MRCLRYLPRLPEVVCGLLWFKADPEKVTDLPTKRFKRYHSDKHLSEFYLQDGGKNQLA